MGEKRHIFISYRSIEAGFALKLTASLKNAGLKAWMDRFELKASADWRREIENALKKDRCALVISVLSPEYIASEYCRIELGRANRLGIPILPVLLRPVDDFPLEVERLQYTPFFETGKSGQITRDWNDQALYHERFDQLIAALPHGLVADTPDPEIQYLNNLIAELESRRGVLEYVELAGEAEKPQNVRACPYEDEWGFALLLDQGKSPAESRKITLNSITEAVDKYPRFLLLGDPGAGKSTTIRRLVRDAARRHLASPRMAPLPLLLYLPQWNDEPTPQEFVRSKWPFRTDPIRLLNTGDVLLYLDGLNEMGADGKRRARLLGKWLESLETPARVITACRTEDYTDGLKLDDTPTVLVQELNEAQLRQFATNYLEKRAVGFLQHVLPKDRHQRKGRRSLFWLARNPYMLSALIYLYAHSPSQDLPRNRGALFRRLVMALWDRERQRNTLGWVPFEEMETAFARLAFAMIDQRKPTDVPLAWALRQIMGKERRAPSSSRLRMMNLLRAGQSASLLAITDTEVRFYHQLVEEYFAAVWLSQVGLRGHLKKRRFHDYFYDQHVWKYSSKWDQVVIALSGIANSDDIVGQVAEIDPYLAADCIMSGVQVEAETRHAVQSRLAKEVRDDVGRGWTYAAEALGQIGDATVVPELLQALRDEPEEYHWISAVPIALEGLGKAAIPQLREALHDRNSRVRSVATEVLKKIESANQGKKGR